MTACCGSIITRRYPNAAANSGARRRPAEAWPIFLRQSAEPDQLEAKPTRSMARRWSVGRDEGGRGKPSFNCATARRNVDKAILRHPNRDLRGSKGVRQGGARSAQQQARKLGRADGNISPAMRLPARSALNRRCAPPATNGIDDTGAHTVQGLAPSGSFLGPAPRFSVPRASRRAHRRILASCVYVCVGPPAPSEGRGGIDPAVATLPADLLLHSSSVVRSVAAPDR